MRVKAGSLASRFFSLSLVIGVDKVLILLIEVLDCTLQLLGDSVYPFLCFCIETSGQLLNLGV